MDTTKNTFDPTDGSSAVTNENLQIHRNTYLTKPLPDNVQINNTQDRIDLAILYANHEQELNDKNNPHQALILNFIKRLDSSLIIRQLFNVCAIDHPATYLFWSQNKQLQSFTASAAPTTLRTSWDYAKAEGMSQEGDKQARDITISIVIDEAISEIQQELIGAAKNFAPTYTSTNNDFKDLSIKIATDHQTNWILADQRTIDRLHIPYSQSSLHSNLYGPYLIHLMGYWNNQAVFTSPLLPDNQALFGKRTPEPYSGDIWCAFHRIGVTQSNQLMVRKITRIRSDHSYRLVKIES